VDSTRQRDLSEIGRLKQNNDVMRQRLLAAIAERDHYLAALKKAGIDAGPVPTPVAAPTPVAPSSVAAPAGAASPGDAGLSVPSPASELPPSGPGDDHGHDASSSVGSEQG
jgi:hypothetical protein